MFLVVLKKETMRHNGEYIKFEKVGVPIEVEDSLAKKMIEFEVAVKYEGEKPAVFEELIAQPIEVEELVEELPKLDEIKLEEPIKLEDKPKPRKRGEKKSYLFSEN